MQAKRFGTGARGAVAAIGVLVVAGCASSSSPNEAVGSSAQAIQNGSLDTTHHFAVGVCGGNRGSCSGFCSGALITPNLVVTARHCVDQTENLIDCSRNPAPRFGNRSYGGNFWITTDPSMYQSTRGWHRVKSVIVPDDDTVCGHDIALLVLTDLVPDAEAHPIIPGIQYSMGDPKYETSFTAVGYGKTSPSASDFGTRRIRGNIPVRYVTCPNGDPGIPGVQCVTGLHDNEFVGGTGTCSGDSGSSAFEQSSFTKANGKNAVSFGVLSRGGDSQDGTACKGSLYTRLDKFRDLVIEAANAASENWSLYGKPVPDWTGPFIAPPVPEAGTDSGPTQPTSTGATGDPCVTDDMCASKLCVDAADGKVCSEACDESVVPTTCPDGFSCSAGVCVTGSTTAPPPAAAGTTTTTTSGCSTSGAPVPFSPSAPYALFGALAGALALSARRRRST